jgi:uncharacterized damage-inducible protein DinB
MNKDDIQLLYEYDRWANNRVLQAAAALSVEQLTRDLGGRFRESLPRIALDLLRAAYLPDNDLACAVL